MVRIAVLDLGAAGAGSIRHALAQVPATDVVVASDAGAIQEADAIVLPSVSSFGEMASRLDASMREAIGRHASSGKPMLGVGVGMHLLFDTSDESPGARGLGLLAGACRAITPVVDPMTRGTTRVPHLGWNRLVIEPAGAMSAAVQLPQGAWVYFDHGYHAEPEDRACVVATTEVGAVGLVAAVAKNNMVGLQFRPERSGQVGARILHAIVSRWC
jgi:glutamine amidotransferase